MQVANHSTNTPTTNETTQGTAKTDTNKIATLIIAIYTSIRFLLSQTAPNMDNQTSSGISLGATIGVSLAYLGGRRFMTRRAQKRAAALEARSLLQISAPPTPALGAHAARITEIDSNINHSTDNLSGSPKISSANSIRRTESDGKIIIGRKSVRRAFRDEEDNENELIPLEEIARKTVKEADKEPAKEAIEEFVKEAIKEPVKLLSPSISPKILRDLPPKPAEFKKSTSAPNVAKLSIPVPILFNINPPISNSNTESSTPIAPIPPITTPRAGSTPRSVSTPRSNRSSPLVTPDLEELSLTSNLMGNSVGASISFNQRENEPLPLASESVLDNMLLPSPRVRDDTPLPSPRSKKTTLSGKAANL